MHIASVVPFTNQLQTRVNLRLFAAVVNRSIFLCQTQDYFPDFANLTHPRARAATVCGTTPEAIHATLCQTADSSKQWNFAIAECPIEAG